MQRHVHTQPGRVAVELPGPQSAGGGSVDFTQAVIMYITPAGEKADCSSEDGGLNWRGWERGIPKIWKVRVKTGAVQERMWE